MRRSIFAVMMLSAGACFSLSAQSGRLEASIPFEFRVVNQTLPAGTYAVTLSNQVVRLSQISGGNANVLTLTNAASKPKGAADDSGRGTLVFRKIGDSYFLSKVFSPNVGDGRELFQGKVEKELIARTKAIETAAVAMSRK